MGITVIISCKDVVKKFDSLLVIDNVSMEVEKGKFIVLLGPSGCGKSTFLNMIAGFEKPTTGSIEVLGEQVDKPNRHYGFVFQDYALFPWKSVRGNVESGLQMKDKNEKRDIAMHFLEKVGLADFADVFPYQLSGGMKQRVGIARALAYDPEILLMDEPFGALDAQTRKLMQQELVRILKDFEKTILFVTHSVIEAVYLADTVYVFSNRPSKVLYKADIEIEGERHYTGEKYLFYREQILHHLNTQTGVHE
jgi:NitT/TauT family transport system ATP-binding protein